MKSISSATLQFPCWKSSAPLATHSDIVLPYYIEPISMHVEGIGLDHLQQKGAFVIPDPACRDQL